MDDHRFKLRDASDVNRYIFCAGGSRPAGFIMSSQLPDVWGSFGCAEDAIGYQGWTAAFFSNGCFKKIPNNGSGPSKGGSRGRVNSLDFRLSYGSNLYKNNITQVFGDAVSMNAFIKALL